MRGLKLIILFTLITTLAYANDSFIELDTTGWSQYQKNMIPAITYRLAYKAGFNIVPEVKENVVTFKNVPLNFDIKKIISEQKVLDELCLVEQENAANATAELAEYNSRVTALKTKLNLSDEELKTLKEIILGKE